MTLPTRQGEHEIIDWYGCYAGIGADGNWGVGTIYEDDYSTYGSYTSRSTGGNIT